MNMDEREPRPADVNSASSPVGAYRYSHDRHASRTAERQASFFSSHLRPGMSLIDLGCGPGSITLDLAEIVAPGQVVGIDMDKYRIDRAKAAANERGLGNVTFQVGSAYELPFPDQSIDAAFEHLLFLHLADPARAAKEVNRVLRPGGVFGARDNDREGFLWGNMNPSIDEFREFQTQLQIWQGSDYLMGKQLRPLLLRAGFADIVSSASYEMYQAPVTLPAMTEERAAMLLLPETLRFAEESGLADQVKLEEWSAALKAWGEEPESFLALAHCEAVGWKPETS